MNINPYAIPGLRRNDIILLMPGKLQRIKTEISKCLDIPLDALDGARRFRDAVQARHIFFYIARKHTTCSLVQIGESVGNRDHTTVIAGIKRINDLMETEPELRKTVKEIEDRI